MKSISDGSAEERATQLEVARKIALDQLAVRQRSAHELRAVFRRRNVPPDIADEILERFTEVGLIDDAAFAEALATSRVQFAKRGRARIRQELQAKGVDREVADEVLAGIDTEDELRGALELARKKARTMSGLEPHVARRRLAGVLARRGYGPGIVSAALADALSEPDVEFSTGQE